MKIDTHLGTDLGGTAERARALEAQGYDGLVSVETQHDPFLPLALAAEHTERVELMTGIAVAFARNPMTLANVGYDLHEYSKGRMILGLGSQIRPHIEKRFSMTWSHPAPRMRELILAIRALVAAPGPLQNVEIDERVATGTYAADRDDGDAALAGGADALRQCLGERTEQRIDDAKPGQPAGAALLAYLRRLCACPWVCLR